MKRKVSDLKVAELKVELEKRGLDSKGLKGVLVQRLQKAIEDEGGNGNDIENVVSETASPKASRRSTGRLKRTTENEDDQFQEEKLQTPEPQSDDNKERAEETNGSESIDETFHSANASEIDQHNEILEEVQPREETTTTIEEAVIDDNGATPTRDEEGDVGTSPVHEDDQEFADVEEVVVSEEIHEEGNDYRDEPVSEEQDEYGQQQKNDDDFVSHKEEIVEDENMADIRESENKADMDRKAEFPDGLTDVKSEGDIAQETVVKKEHNTTEKTDPDGTNFEQMKREAESMDTDEISSVKQEPMDFKDDDYIEDTKIKVESIADEKTIDEKPVDEKQKSETGKDDVVTAEEDFLDMLDYDLEITADQNINSEDQQTKTSESEGASTAQKDTGKSTNEKNANPSQPRRTRQSSDSLKRPSSDQSKSGGQSSSKSSTSASKDAKATSSGKRESTGSSTSKKEDSLNKNLWISGLSSTTRASELKSAFSRYGKVIGAKVVTNVKSPGSRCYGYVTMGTVEAASKCILHLNNTEMHGRMITVEIAKGDPSASSKKPSTSSGSSAKRESDAKDDSSKSKDSASKPSSTSGRRQSAAGASLSSSKDKEASDDKDETESEKNPTSDAKGKESGSSTRKSTDDAKRTGKSKSPARDRSRADRTSTSGPRSGEKRHGNRSPGHNRSAGSSRAGGMGSKDEPERKRARQPDAADRKVVIDSNKGELRVNVSRDSGRAARWQGNDSKPKPLLSRRRSASPPRRKPLSPVRGSVLSRTGRGGRGGRIGGRGGLLSRQEDRLGSRRSTGRGGILSFNQIRAQQRERDRARIAERGARLGGAGPSRADLHADRERLRREREERDKLRLERERLERERRQLEKDRQERERLEAERLRLEAERKRELERIEREKAEMRRLQEITRYEVEQRQRAIKRTYDDDSSHRSNRSSNRDMYDSKRQMVSDRDIGRNESRRGGGRDERRGYDSYNQRGGPTRNGPSSRNDSAAEPPPPGTTSYRTSQGSYHGSGAPGDGRGKSNASSGQYRDSRRSDADARYGGVSGSSGSSSGRTVEKYDRRGGSGDAAGRSVEYSHAYDRDAIDSQRRRPAAQSGRDPSSGRKVVRERSAEHRTSNASGQDFRRPGGRGPSGARIEITREQSPPVRRARRESSPSSARAPAGGSRAASWRDSGKSSGRETSRRGVDDRDLREQIRGGRQDTYSDPSRDRGSQRRGGDNRTSHSPSPPARSSSQYQGRWPDGADSTSSQQMYSTGVEGSSIPTTGRNTGSSSWMQQWAGAAQNVRAWPGSSIPATATSALSRQMLAAAGYGSVAPSPTALIAPPQSMIPVTQGYIPSSDNRQSRSSFPANYKPIQRRY